MKKLLLGLFLLGVALGISGTIFVPDLVRPYLPKSMQGDVKTVDATVVAKKLDGSDLLLTLQTDQGAVLATFKRKVPKIDLLVSMGDMITLVLDEYEPFIEDPVIKRVVKETSVRQPGGFEASPPALPEATLPVEKEPTPLDEQEAAPSVKKNLPPSEAQDVKGGEEKAKEKE